VREPMQHALRSWIHWNSPKQIGAKAQWP
jgi:hypothetical protein